MTSQDDNRSVMQSVFPAGGWTQCAFTLIPVLAKVVSYGYVTEGPSFFLAVVSGPIDRQPTVSCLVDFLYMNIYFISQQGEFCAPICGNEDLYNVI